MKGDGFLGNLWYCWCFRNPANQLRLVVYPIIYCTGFYTSQVVQDFWTINSSCTLNLSTKMHHDPWLQFNWPPNSPHFAGNCLRHIFLSQVFLMKKWTNIWQPSTSSHTHTNSKNSNKNTQSQRFPNIKSVFFGSSIVSFVFDGLRDDKSPPTSKECKSPWPRTNPNPTQLEMLTLQKSDIDTKNCHL